MHKRIVVFTSESVWLVEQGETSAYVLGRASFGQHMPNQHDYSGPVVNGPDGPVLKVGASLVFTCQCGAAHVNFAGAGKVVSGTITRIVEHSLRPAREVPEGYIDITPSWSGALWLLVEAREWQGLKRMAEAADRYVAAVSLGLITQGDLPLIEARKAL